MFGDALNVGFVMVGCDAVASGADELLELFVVGGAPMSCLWWHCKWLLIVSAMVLWQHDDFSCIVLMTSSSHDGIRKSNLVEPKGFMQCYMLNSYIKTQSCPFTKSWPNGHDYVKGQDLVSTIQI